MSGLDRLVVNPVLLEEHLTPEGPVVVWDNEISQGEWHGSIVLFEDNSPQAELRRQLPDGTDVVVRLSLGNVISRKQGEVKAGVVISMNGPLILGWTDYYTLLSAVSEGVGYLVGEHEKILNSLAGPKRGVAGATG